MLTSKKENQKILISNTPWNEKDLDSYVVWCSMGDVYFMNSWLDLLDAIQERDSLNKSDSVAHYYVTYMGEML